MILIARGRETAAYYSEKAGRTTGSARMEGAQFYHPSFTAALYCFVSSGVVRRVLSSQNIEPLKFRYQPQVGYVITIRVS